jgi:hypothetical protein
VVPGMSHQPLQFINTGNLTFPLDLYARAFSFQDRVAIEDFRRFLHSLCYPKGDAGTIDDKTPPRVLMVWPHVWSITCVVTSLKIVATSFAIDGRISRYMATVSLEEIRDGRLTSEDVRRHGTRRSPAGSGESA